MRRWMHTLHRREELGQPKVLRALLARGAMTQRELQERLRIRPGSVSELVTKLENRGLVRRDADAADRRRAMLSLTEAGQATAEAAPPREDPYGALSAEEQETLKTLLQKLLAGREE